MPPQPFNEIPQQPVNVVLINAHDNPVAVIDQAHFNGNWQWFKTPPAWKPAEPLPTEAAKVDAMIVFAAKYREEEIRELCESVRRVPQWDAIPLLVAVDQYQMPLANRVRELPNTDFIVIPVEEAALTTHLNRALESRK